jgi:hypothetical protein
MNKCTDGFLEKMKKAKDSVCIVIILSKEKSLQSFPHLVREIGCPRNGNHDRPGRSRPAVNGRTPIIYDEKRRLFTVIVYGSHIRLFTVYYAYHKQ